jgi:hypothetical protein
MQTLDQPNIRRSLSKVVQFDVFDYGPESEEGRTTDRQPIADVKNLDMANVGPLDFVVAASGDNGEQDNHEFQDLTMPHHE